MEAELERSEGRNENQVDEIGGNVADALSYAGGCHCDVEEEVMCKRWHMESWRLNWDGPALVV